MKMNQKEVNTVKVKGSRSRVGRSKALHWHRPKGINLKDSARIITEGKEKRPLPRRGQIQDQRESSAASHTRCKQLPGRKGSQEGIKEKVMEPDKDQCHSSYPIYFISVPNHRLFKRFRARILTLAFFSISFYPCISRSAHLASGWDNPCVSYQP